MAEIKGPGWFVARVQRVLSMLTSAEHSRVRAIHYGGNQPYRAMSGGHGDVTLYDNGLAGSDEHVASLISHENWHLDHGIDESGAVAAEAETLRRLGRDDLAAACEANAASPEYQSALTGFWGSPTSLPAAGERTQAQAVDDWVRAAQAKADGR